MATTASRLISGSQMTGTAATYYTSPASTKTVIKALTLVNTTAGAVACTVYLVPNAGSPGASNAVVNARTLAVNESYTCPESINHVLEAGGYISAFGLNVTIVASGVQIT
jgi:hypothetical protein